MVSVGGDIVEIILNGKLGIVIGINNDLDIEVDNKVVEINAELIDIIGIVVA